jgi:hypothetical protein
MPFTVPQESLINKWIVIHEYSQLMNKLHYLIEFESAILLYRKSIFEKALAPLFLPFGPMHLEII